MSDTNKAVFLSYASQDAGAAKGICEALRAAGVEVWFDQSELRGGDAWDQKIRKQIKECALFVPIVSANTQARTEGYFRLEWRLADQRTHLMARARPFLLPVVIDDTRDVDAHVPDSFNEVQWTRLPVRQAQDPESAEGPSGETTAAFCARVKMLLGGDLGPRASSPAPTVGADGTPALPGKAVRRWLTPAILGATAIVALAIWQPWTRTSPAEAAGTTAPLSEPSNSKPQTPNSELSRPLADAKSVAVLAFRQLGADSENEYLCEAISDELCSVLGRVPGLRVAASASAFSFKGKGVRPAEMAAQLGVAYLVAGTVQKVGQRVRVRAQLIKAADESAVWSSDTLEHELKDMFAVQDEIVGAIAKNLQLRLGAVTRPVVTNPEAYRLYYEGRRAWSLRGVRTEVDRAEELYRKALELDPFLGRAYAGLADVTLYRSGTAVAGRFGSRTSPEAAEILALATKAVQLEPDSAETHTTRGNVLWFQWQRADAERELRAAIKLNPNHADAHELLGRLSYTDGRMDEGLAELRVATELDPLTSGLFVNYSLVLINAGRFREALAQADRALALQPDSGGPLRARMSSLSKLGRYDEAVSLARSPGVKWGSSTHHATVETFAYAGLVQEGVQASATLTGSGAARAAALAALGRRDEALAALDADEMSAQGVSYLLYRPALDPIRNDPHFVRVLEQLGLKDAHARAQAWRAAHPPEKPAAKK